LIERVWNIASIDLIVVNEPAWLFIGVIGNDEIGIIRFDLYFPSLRFAKMHVVRDVLRRADESCRGFGRHREGLQSGAARKNCQR